MRLRQKRCVSAPSIKAGADKTLLFLNSQLGRAEEKTGLAVELAFRMLDQSPYRNRKFDGALVGIEGL